MTAEIVIMNKMGVAMAADSAVTVAGKKVYNSANKLFMLSKYHPVGIMVYGNAEFMGFPWEVLIKLFREELGKEEFDTVSDYADHFFDFLSKSEYISNQDEIAFVTQMAFPIYAEIIKRIRGSIDALIQKTGSVNDKDSLSIVDAEIGKMFDEINQRDLYFELTQKIEVQLVKKFTPGLSKKLLSTFDKLPLTATQKTKLIKIGAMAISRKVFDHESGIVLAGFGKAEIFPSMLSCEIKCRANKKLIRSKTERAEISPSLANGNTAVIKPFAQGEMVHAFMEGIDPYLNRLSYNYLEKVFRELPQKLLEHLNLANNADLKQALLNAGKDVFENYQKAVRDYQRDNHVNPVLSAVASLPKDELAAMAESLINLTSFKRKVTIETETVGGAIDVAVISKGDGFIWIKRKHYFQPQLNHHFTTNYFEGKSCQSEN
jgi:hypothetical protein